MRPTLMLIAAACLALPYLASVPAHADASLEARVLRLEAQVKALQESLKSALQTERVYSIRTAGGPDSCLSSGNADAAAKSEVFVGKCRTDDGGTHTWKIIPAQ
jgi:hypothetical protein